MKRLVYGTIVLLLLCAALPRGATAIEGLRGATWGELRYDIPKDGRENLLLDGWVKQGVDWTRWGNTTLNTYAKLRYRWDSEGHEWNNLLGPAVGVSLDTYVPAGLALSVGIEYTWENRLLANDNGLERKAIAYVNWYGWWDLLKR